MTKHQEYIKAVLDHIAKGGKMVFNKQRRGKVMSIKKRLEIQIIDKIEQQVQHCLREYENDLLEDKLIDLAKEWFFKGFFSGRDYEQENGSNLKCRQFALGQILNSWPDNWDYDRIIEELNHGDPDHVVREIEIYQGTPAVDLATIIEELRLDLEKTFK